MDAFESEFARRLTNRIEEASAWQCAVMNGGNLSTYEEYKAKCSYIQALRDVGAWMEEVRQELTQPEERAREPVRPLRQTASYSGV